MLLATFLGGTVKGEKALVPKGIHGGAKTLKGRFLDPREGGALSFSLSGKDCA
jgi:hypothetical protein